VSGTVIGANDQKCVYGHDYAGNRIYRVNWLGTALDYYGYDGLHRLRKAEHGEELNGGIKRDRSNY